jgi:O-antigen/teichoic acid export membrane protein
MGENKNLAQKTLAGLIWAGSEAFARAGLQFGVLIVLARLLTPEDYGVVGAALVVIGISQVFAQLGLGPAVVQRDTVSSTHLNTAFWFSLLFSLIAGSLIAVTAPWFAAFFQLPKLTPTLQVLSLVFPLTGAAVVSESLLQRELKFRTLARIEVSSYFTGFAVVGIVLAVLKFGLWALVAAQLTQMCVRSIQMLFAARWRPQPEFSFEALKELWRFGGGQTTAQIANYIAQSADVMVVGKTLGAGAMGIYTRAYQLMLAPAVLVGSVLEKVLFPALSKIQHQPELLASAYRQANRLLAVLILPTAAIIIILAPDVIPLALGQKWAGVALPLQLFSLGLLWRTGIKISNSVIRACGAARSFAACQIMYASTVILFAWFGSRWGIQGICLGVLISICGSYSFAAAVCFRLTGVTLNQFLLDHTPGFLLAISTAAVGESTQIALHSCATPILLSCIFTTLGMGVTLLIALGLLPGYFLGHRGEKLKAKISTFVSRAPAFRNRTA